MLKKNNNSVFTIKKLALVIINWSLVISRAILCQNFVFKNGIVGQEIQHAGAGQTVGDSELLQVDRRPATDGQESHRHVHGQHDAQHRRDGRNDRAAHHQMSPALLLAESQTTRYLQGSFSFSFAFEFSIKINQCKLIRIFSLENWKPTHSSRNIERG